MATGPDFGTAMRFATAGIEVLVAFGLCAAGGVWLDRRAGGGTLWPIVGGAVGFGFGMWNLIRIAKQYRKDADGSDGKDGKDKP